MHPRACLLLAVVLLTACGDDALSRSELLQQAEALCRTANTSLEQAAAPTTPEQIAPYFRTLLDTAGRVTDELESLVDGHPDSEELQRTFLVPLRAQVDALEVYLPQVEQAARDGKQALAALQEPVLPPADLAAMRDYGFQACVVTARS